jgi:ribosome-binding protein aMBF1 (putative translation factor)
VPSGAKSKLRPISSDTPSGRRSPRRARRRKPESSAVQFLYDRYVGTDPALMEAYDREVLNAQLARRIFELRTRAGLSQRQLAERVGTSASAICRLEDADYEGHSLPVLKRIAEALGRRLEIRFVPQEAAGKLSESRP